MSLSAEQPQRTSKSRRISDEEWEGHKDFIIEFYSQNKSRKDILQELTAKGLAATEKQLKHVLQKWDIKKKVKDHDMQSMLSLKRKRDMQGKASQFVYHGALVSNEKLQRAAKRAKVLPASPGITHGIQVLSPEISTASICISSDTVSTIISGALSAAHQTQCSTNLPVSSPRLMPDPFKVATRPLICEAYHNTIDFVQHPEPYQDSQFCPLSMIDSGSVTERSTSRVRSVGCIPQQLSATESFNVSDCMDLDLDDLLPTPVPNSPISLSSPTASFRISFPGYQLETNDSRTALSLDDTVMQTYVNGQNPERFVYPLQALHKSLQNLRDSCHKCCRLHPRVARTQPKRDFFDPLIDDIQHILTQVSSSANRTTHPTECTSKGDTMLGHKLTNSQNHEYSEGRELSAGLQIGTSRLVPGAFAFSVARSSFGASGTVSIDLHHGLATNYEAGKAQPYYFVISFITETGLAAYTGVQVTLQRNDRTTPLCASITPFNVVPEDAAIVRSVAENNTDQFMSLIRTGRASARDVDPGGVSLLHRAMYSGCTEIFRYLVANGASTDNCLSFGSPATLVDSVWNAHVDLVSSSGWFIVGNGALSKPSEVIAMTNIAVSSGACCEQSIPGNKIIPSPLFLIMNGVDATYNGLQDAVTAVCAVGYDTETRNDLGQTPLLFAAQSLKNRSLSTLRVLIFQSANVHACDDQKMGALHWSFDFNLSWGLVGFLAICPGPKSTTQKSFGTPSLEVLEEYATLPLDQAYVAELKASWPPGGLNQRVERNTQLPKQNLRRCPWCDILDREEHSANHFLLDADEEEEEEEEEEDDPWQPAFHYCALWDVDDFEDIPLSDLRQEVDIEPPSWMCKKRQRLKLLILLRAGCDPNALDKDNRSPSDYAAEEGLWPQWEWALAHSGWRYDRSASMWIRV